ncbi:MAG: carbon-nitrogen hydrolase family protein [Azospirillaceae bacterium]
MGDETAIHDPDAVADRPDGPGRVTVACLQLNSGPDYEPNLRVVGDLARRAADGGARLIATPENVGVLATGRSRLLERAFPEPDHPGLAALRDLARETGAWMIVGSLPVLVETGRAASRCFLLTPEGKIAARYDKMHMFDVDLPGGETYRESATYRPGDAAVVAEAPWGAIGLSICYDLRFPHLYRDLAKTGAGILSIPSSFTEQTGRAHWHVLVRARAIETGCFVLAPAQVGRHDGNRRTYGHSLIVDPWGGVLADAGETVGVVTAELDLGRVAEARGAIAALGHDRPYALPAAPARAT